LEAEAVARQPQLEAAARTIEDLQRLQREMDLSLRSEVGLRSAAEELGKRVPALEGDLAATRQRCEQLTVSETQTKERVARLESELSSAMQRAQWAGANSFSRPYSRARACAKVRSTSCSKA
jgi:predicted  nucleic acid-binding Zn-ribbon protein